MSYTRIQKTICTKKYSPRKNIKVYKAQKLMRITMGIEKRK